VVENYVWGIEEILGAVGLESNPALTMRTARMVRLVWVGPLSVATAVLALPAVQTMVLRARFP
jgi:hypothetical protein